MAEPLLTPEELAALAVEPKETTVNGQVANAHPLPDVVEMDKYLSAKQATTGRKSAWRSVVTAYGIPPNANGR